MLFYKGERMIKVNHADQSVKTLLGGLKAKELEQ
jgi:hypothetical protein